MNCKNCRYYDIEEGWCSLKMDWSEAMPIITWCNDEVAKQCEDYKENV